MASYKKSFLSAAAAIAISASVVSADYLPLANAALDDKWMLFGASGFLSDGAVAGEAGVFTIASGVANAITDAYTGHELFETSGLTVGAGNIGALKALNAANDSIQIRVDTTGATFNDTEPTRTIYVDTDNDGIGDFAFTYKAQLEGERLEYSVNSGDVYYLTVNYSNTYDNPAQGTLILGSDPITGTNLDDLVDLGDGTLIDYTFANNPVNYLNFDAATHSDAPADDESLRLYSYDANNGGLWNLFDSRYANSANDFLSLEKGRGYWGKLDMGTQGANAPAGLVLGSSTIAAADYQALNLTEGWNLLAFNKANNSELRHANTGLLVTFNALVDAETFTIKDSSGIQAVTVTVVAADGIDGLARNINFAITQAKAQGTLPRTFDLRAFPTATALQLALVSNKKFSIYEDDDVDNVIAGTTTLANGNPIDLASETRIAVADVLETGVSSVYGEYAMVMEPLAGVGASLLSAAAGAKLNIKSQLETVAGGTDNDVTIVTDLATAVANLAGATAINAYEFDIDQDGTTDHALLASTEPFYVRDQTFSRVFSYADSGTLGTITITGAGAQNVASINVATGSNAAAVAGVIDATVAMAGADGTNVVVVTTDPAASEFAVYSTGGGDNLAVSSTNAVLAQGSVADVYSLSHLAKKGLADFELEAAVVGAALAVTDGELFAFEVTTLSGADITLATYTAVAADGDDVPATFYPRLQTFLNAQLAANDLEATATFVVGADFAATLTITGPDVIDIAIAAAPANTTDLSIVPANNTLEAGAIDTTSLAGNLASDLKYNAVYSPNYVMDGPLYTMREAGYDLKALVTGTMPMDIPLSTMQWDSIDLTRVPSEWFTSQDYNLFDTDEQAGYWGYLEENAAANPLSIGNISLSPLDYVHYYDGTTTTNAFSTNIKVAVNGIDETRDPDTLNGGSKSARVTATIGGKKTELTRESQNLYSGKINFYEVEGVNANTAFSIVIDAADGLGNKISTTTSLIDNQKPTAPTASFDGSSITISSPSTDVAAYYVFNNTIPEVYSAGNELLHLENEPDGEVIGSGICGATVTVASAVGSLKVVAVDGEGEIYKGNVSNSASVAYMAIAKNRIVLSDINNNENDASVGGTPYSTACAAGTPVTTNDYAMQLTSMTNTKTAKIAFPVMASGVDLTGTPITEYVRNDANDAVAKITYAPAYAGEEVFVMLNGVVFGHTLSARAVAELTTPTAGTNLNAGIKTGVTF